VDGCAIDVASQHLSPAARHPPPGVSAAINKALLEAMAAHPGASSIVLGRLIGRSPGAVIGRLRLGREGALVPCASGRWRLPTPGERPIAEAGEELSEFEIAERSPPVPAFVPGAWVQHIDRYVRASTSMFACRRYG
jgi:hypothetical protein